MIFFDFLYYSLYRYYSRHKEKSAASIAATLVGGFQTANIVTSYMVIVSLARQKIQLDKLWVIALFIVFQITSYFRYIKKDAHSVIAIEQKWMNMTQLQRNQFGLAIFIYGAFSIIAFFGLAIYLGNRK